MGSSLGVQPPTSVFPLKNPLPFTTLVLDLGDVLSFYSVDDLDDLSIAPPLLKLIISSPDWHSLECGRVSRQDCFARLATAFKIAPQDLEETLGRLAATLTYNHELVDTVRELKEAAGEGLRVLLATNICQHDWVEHLRSTVESWGIFDHIFTSFEVGERKPEKAFYRRMLDGAGPSQTVFVDDESENLVAARLLGIHALQFKSTQDVVVQLRSMFGDPVARGEGWMREHAREMWSTSSTGVLLKEQYSQLLLLEVTEDRSLVTLAEGERRLWNVFIDKPLLTTAVYPDDLDSTTLGLLNVGASSDEIKHEVLDQFLEYLRDDGLFYTYFDKNRPRIDPVVSADVLRIFYACGRGHELRSTLDTMVAMAETRAYEFAMHYYMHPDWFFYYLSDLCRRNPDRVELVAVRSLLRERLAERSSGNSSGADTGTGGGGGGGGGGRWDNDALAASLRLVAANNLGMDNRRDLEVVLRTQQHDGAWSKEPWVWRFGHGVLFGNPGLITALAVKGLRGLSEKLKKEVLTQ